MVPGDRLNSVNFEVMLVSAHQEGRGCYAAEYHHDWRPMIEIILKTVEALQGGQEELQRALNSSLSFLDVRVTSQLRTRRYFKDPSARLLRVTFNINKPRSTGIEMFLRRRRVIRSLRELCLEKVTNVYSFENVQKLSSSGDVPVNLAKDVLNTQKCWWRLSSNLQDDEDEVDNAPRSMQKRNVAWRADDFKASIP